ncbi:MAG: hypothetical protein ACTSU3_05330 [Candidatus Thorarchaeota archaeon]
MKRALQIVLALSFVGMFLVSPVAAATSQGFEWGVSLGDSFEFTMTNSEDGVTEGIYLNITGTATLAIPDPLTDWNNIPADIDIDFWWANGTSMGFYALVFLGLMATGAMIVVPIGNWTVLSTLIAAELTGETATDTSSLWGVVWTNTINATHETRITAHYAKADGFLAEYKMETAVSATNAVVESFTVIRDDIPAGPGGGVGDIVQLLTDNILYIGIGVVVLLLVAILIKKK